MTRAQRRVCADSTPARFPKTHLRPGEHHRAKTPGTGKISAKRAARVGSWGCANPRSISPQCHRIPDAFHLGKTQEHSFEKETHIYGCSIGCVSVTKEQRQVPGRAKVEQYPQHS